SRRRHTRSKRDWSSDVCSSDLISQISVDNETADYLRRNNNHELHRIDEMISKKDDIIRYKLCLKKRSFDFYLRKQNLWNYKVIRSEERRVGKECITMKACENQK